MLDRVFIFLFRLSVVLIAIKVIILFILKASLVFSCEFIYNKIIKRLL